jgi:hypothetical protein
MPGEDSLSTPEQMLRQRLQEARREYLETDAKFNNLVKSLPTGVPHPDGRFQIQQIAAERAKAFQRYTDLLKTMQSFLLSRGQ